jgi:hypothetical protein
MALITDMAVFDPRIMTEMVFEPYVSKINTKILIICNLDTIRQTGGKAMLDKHIAWLTAKPNARGSSRPWISHVG